MSAKRQLRDRLAELHQAAGKPPYATVVRHTLLNLAEAGAPAGILDKQRVSSWLSAANPMTPDTFDKLEAFVTALVDLIEARGGTAPAWRPRERRELWEQARRRQQPDPRLRKARARWALPPDTLAFTGRADELAWIAEGAAGGVVSIHAIDGMPGVGKTALAVHAAHRLAEAFPDGRLFLDLQAHTPGRPPADPADALVTLLTADGVDPRYVPETLDGRAALWRDRSAGKRILLVLDNAAGSAQVGPLLPGDPECVVLVTSRRRLGDLPGRTRHLALGLLPPVQARAMFLSQAPRAAADPVAEVDEVVTLAGRLPLAISLLAKVYTAHPSWALRDLRAEVETRLLTLTAEHATVAAAFDLSFDSLPAAGRRFLLHLALHPGTDIDPYAAAALAGVPLDAAVDLLDALHRENLLLEAGYRRYGLHDLIRTYAQARARNLADGDRRSAIDRLLGYYTHTALLAGRFLVPWNRPVPPGSAPEPSWAVPELPTAVRALTWFRTERANLLAAAAQGGPQLIVGLAGLLRMDGPWADGITLYEAAAVAPDDWTAAYALTCLADMHRLRSDYAHATETLHRAREVYARLGSRLGEANVLALQGIVAYSVGEHADARRSLTEALDGYVAQGDRLGESNVLLQLGISAYMAGDLPGAAELMTRSLARSRELDDRLLAASTLTLLGYVHQMRGDYPAAATALHEALELCREVGDRLREASALQHLGAVLHRTGDRAGAEAALTRSVTASREVGSQLGEAIALNFLGTLQRERGDSALAVETLTQASDLARRLGVRGGEVEALNELGAAHRDLGDLERATGHHERALSLAKEIDSPIDEARSLAGLGRTALAAGRRDEGTANLRAALAVFVRLGAAEATELAAELET